MAVLNLGPIFASSHQEAKWGSSERILNVFHIFGKVSDYASCSLRSGVLVQPLLMPLCQIVEVRGSSKQILLPLSLIKLLLILAVLLKRYSLGSFENGMATNLPSSFIPPKLEGWGGGGVGVRDISLIEVV